MISKVELSKVECQTLQEDKYALVLSVGNIEKESQDTLENFGKLQQGCQVLEAEIHTLRLSVEELNKEKGRLEYKVTKLEVQ